MELFVMSFDTEFHAFDQRKLETLLTNHRLIEGWSTPYSGIYFLKSAEADAEKISDSIEEFFDKDRFFVVRATGSNPDEINGRLAMEIWKAIKAPDSE